MTEKQWFDILMKHFNDCLRYWERTLNVDSDLSNEAYINAIKDIPHNNPFGMQGEPILEDIRKRFFESRMMDCFGTDWQKHLNEVM